MIVLDFFSPSQEKQRVMRNPSLHHGQCESWIHRILLRGVRMPIDSSRWLRRRRRRRPTRRDGRRRARGLGAAGDVRTTVAIVGALA